MRLLELLPDFYAENETMVLLQELLSERTEVLETILGEVIRDCFVSTARGLLARYETLYGLPIDSLQSETIRRERIFAKLAGAGTSTKEMIRQTASAYTNGEIEVIEDNENYTFLIRFVGERGIPENMKNLMTTIEEIKPAHLAVEYEYTYNTWSDCSSSTWSELSGYTWNEIRTVNL